MTTDQTNSSNESPIAVRGPGRFSPVTVTAPISSTQSRETPRGNGDAAATGAITPSGTGGEFDLRGITDETSPTGKARSAEKVLIRERSHHDVSNRISSDDQRGVVTQEVGEKLQPKGISMTIHLYNLVTHKYVYYEGQAFVVQDPDKPESQIICTAKHNLVSEHNDKGEYEICDSHRAKLAEGYEAGITFRETGWVMEDDTPVVLRDKDKWKRGIDIAFGPSVDPRSVLHDPELLVLANPSRAHDGVGGDFEYQVGMYICIVVYSTTGPSAEKLRNEAIDEDSYPKHFGRKMETIINTGTITYVGENHIEYNINTCGGISGAAVVLLEKDHPDFLKAIAVHAGYKDSLDINVGFKLAGLVVEDQE